METTVRKSAGMLRIGLPGAGGDGPKPRPCHRRERLPHICLQPQPPTRLSKPSPPEGLLTSLSSSRPVPSSTRQSPIYPASWISATSSPTAATGGTSTTSALLTRPSPIPGNLFTAKREEKRMRQLKQEKSCWAGGTYQKIGRWAG
ncbi:unnamed protein product, partial [Musa acuminata var. zebrina]